MPTSISSPASFSSVRTAFNTEGYGISTSLFAYRKGGGIVPNTSQFNPIGGSPLQLSQFNGFSVPSPVISIEYILVSVDDVYMDPLDYQIAEYGILSNGLIELTFGKNEAGIDAGAIVTEYNGNWVTPTSAAANYQVRATAAVGPFLEPPTSGVLNTWQTCDQDRKWSLSYTGSGQKQSDLTIEIRDIATSTIRDTATVTLFVKNGA
jgi:hypothetical protein